MAANPIDLWRPSNPHHRTNTRCDTASILDESDPATHVTQTRQTPPPTATSARTPQRKAPPAAVTPATPGRDTPMRPILQTPRQAPETPNAPPAAIIARRGPPAPAIGQGRSTRATSVPTWHNDYSIIG